MTHPVLVAGGAGFIGAALVKALLARSDQVVILDDLSTGQSETARALEQAGAIFIKGSVTDLPRLTRCRMIYNLASPASPAHYLAAPLDTWEANVLGTRALAQLALEWGATFVQASTSEVYGDPLNHPQREVDWGHVNPIGPRACYDESKRAAEAYLGDMIRHKGLDARIARIFNTYGPGMATADGRLLPNFLAQVRAGEPLTIYGTGAQTRSLCHVEDLVSGLIRLAETDQARGQVFNLGNPDERAVLEIARIVIALTGARAGLRFLPLPTDDPRRRCPDISKARKILGWSPRIDLRDGLKRLINPAFVGQHASI